MCLICQGHAQNFTSIDICTEVRKIPVIESLAEINCANNHNIVEIPKMPNLEYINIYNCKNLRKIGNKRLKTLVLKETAVNTEELATLESLEMLKISSVLSIEIPDIPNLYSLDIEGICKYIHPIKSLITLTIINDYLTKIPYIHGLKNLVIMSNNGKIQLPEFPELEELHIYDTRFVNIPRSVKKLTLCRCSLVVIPKLTNLQTLEIKSCKSITKKPFELPMFKKLLRLTIVNTSIKNIPVFPRLFYLRIRGLHVLPPKMPNLKRVLAF
jgi:hypothetical protein